VNDVLIVIVDILGDVVVTIPAPKLDVLDPFVGRAHRPSDLCGHHTKQPGETCTDLTASAKHNSLEWRGGMELVVELNMLSRGRKPAIHLSQHFNAPLSDFDQEMGGRKRDVERGSVISVSWLR
jgi:hypothetical protein